MLGTPDKCTQATGRVHPDVLPEEPGEEVEIWHDDSQAESRYSPGFTINVEGVDRDVAWTRQWYDREKTSFEDTMSALS